MWQGLIMLFRAWYRICQSLVIWFPLAIAGDHLPPSWHVAEICIGIIMSGGLAGAILPFIWMYKGLRSACPLCAAVGNWVAPEKHYLAIDCPECGLVGGCMSRDFRLRKLHEVRRDDSSLHPDSKASN
jgi:predicted RNA-binding Zn-ribbon protein involved in translation (DUF1610 family)